MASSDPVEVRRARASERGEALHALLWRMPHDDRRTRVESILAAASKPDLPIDRLWVAVDQGRLIGAALGWLQPDGVYLTLPPGVPPTTTCDAMCVARRLVAAIVQEMNASSWKLGQLLLSTEELEFAEPFQLLGFSHSTDLHFLARTTEQLPEATLPPDFRWIEWNEPTNADRFARLIEATYLQSEDVPCLAGLRNGVDALATHRLSGTLRPGGWRLLTGPTGDVAVLLLGDHATENAVELIYMGVSPMFRGRGFGRQLVIAALHTAAGWNRSATFLAVDAANASAVDVYRSIGFTEIDRRRLLLRLPG